MDCDFGKLTYTFQFSIKQESLPARVAVRCETADGKLSALGLAWRGVSNSGRNTPWKVQLVAWPQTDLHFSSKAHRPPIIRLQTISSVQKTPVTFGK